MWEEGEDRTEWTTAESGVPMVELGGLYINQ